MPSVEWKADCGKELGATRGLCLSRSSRATRRSVLPAKFVSYVPSAVICGVWGGLETIPLALRTVVY